MQSRITAANMDAILTTGLQLMGSSAPGGGIVVYQQQQQHHKKVAAAATSPSVTDKTTSIYLKGESENPNVNAVRLTPVSRNVPEFH